jgi:hypothetical protein
MSIDVAEWLKGFGLERYEPAFREHEIDWEALPKLTAEDLKDLGWCWVVIADDCSTRLRRSTHLRHRRWRPPLRLPSERPSDSS